MRAGRACARRTSWRSRGTATAARRRGPGPCARRRGCRTSGSATGRPGRRLGRLSSSAMAPLSSATSSLFSARVSCMANCDTMSFTAPPSHGSSADPMIGGACFSGGPPMGHPCQRWFNIEIPKPWTKKAVLGGSLPSARAPRPPARPNARPYRAPLAPFRAAHPPKTAFFVQKLPDSLSGGVLADLFVD